MVKNASNGYIATVFHRPDFSFTTDYINLSEGKNEIDVSIETSSGTRVKKLSSPVPWPLLKISFNPAKLNDSRPVSTLLRSEVIAKVA